MTRAILAVTAATLVAGGCRKAPNLTREVNQLLASYSPELKLGATLGEVTRFPLWHLGRPYNDEVSGMARFPQPVFGVVVVRAYFGIRDDSVRQTDRAVGYIMGSDTLDAVRAAIVIPEHVTRFLGAPKRLGCTGAGLVPERAMGWDTHEYEVRVYVPDSIRSGRHAVRLVIGRKGFDPVRLRPCPRESNQLQKPREKH